MLKVLIGWMNEDHGTVEVTPGGLEYAGEDPEHTVKIVEREREWYS